MKITAWAWRRFSEDFFARCDRGQVPETKEEAYLAFAWPVLDELNQGGHIPGDRPIELPLEFAGLFCEFRRNRYEPTIPDLILEGEQRENPAPLRVPKIFFTS